MHNICWQDKGVVVTFDKTATIEMINQVHKHIQGHALFDNHKHQIWDFRNIDTITATGEELEVTAAISWASSLSAPAIRIAWVGSDELILDLFNLYIHNSKKFGSPWDFMKFTDITDALEWAKR